MNRLQPPTTYIWREPRELASLMVRAATGLRDDLTVSRIDPSDPDQVAKFVEVEQYDDSYEAENGPSGRGYIRTGDQLIKELEHVTQSGRVVLAVTRPVDDPLIDFYTRVGELVARD